MGILAIITIVAAYFFGLSLIKTNMVPYLHDALPEADQFKANDNNIITAYRKDQVIGYVAVDKAMGWVGPIEVAVGVDLEGNILGASIISEHETPFYYSLVVGNNFINTFVGRTIQDPLNLEEDVDGISRATFTSRAITDAIRKGSRQISSEALQLLVDTEAESKIQFGIPEITLIGLYVVGFIGHRRNFKYKKQYRWFSMLTGIIVLGFWLNRPLTIGNISQLLMGYWPNWRTNLYWFLLIGGIFIVFTVDNKNPYCEWICPFGGVQECLGAIGGAKVHSAGRYNPILKWMQRGLAWLAILLAMIFHNPGISSYEVFGNLFSLSGSAVLFVVLGIVLITSLFIRRPWCTYLCPIHPVLEFIRMIRKWIIDLWRKYVQIKHRSSHT